MKNLFLQKNLTNNALIKFILAFFAGLGLVKMVGFLTEEELDGEELEVYEEEEFPLFV
ncbi:hypothetical protein [Flavobacterium rhizosphaerae]|uniref:Uncharacterized protein n=1 Tax=Flavobacterium rhizosphaerae TaxID=3163298 RepID=A0ABW8YV17_9FLAO